MSDQRLTEHALKLMCEYPGYVADARNAMPGINDTLLGGIMSDTLDIPRWVAEQAVRDAVRTMDARGRKPMRGRQQRVEDDE